MKKCSFMQIWRHTLHSFSTFFFYIFLSVAYPDPNSIDPFGSRSVFGIQNPYPTQHFIFNYTPWVVRHNLMELYIKFNFLWKATWRLPSMGLCQLNPVIPSSCSMFSLIFCFLFVLPSILARIRIRKNESGSATLFFF